ncbi:MAG: hypothetical protein ACJAT4_001110 [Granulosicoccus sp.]|jgi:hypothetical protein
MDLKIEINDFIETITGESLESFDVDIFKDLRIAGDDFHEMIFEFSEKYKVNMDDYLWYFHADEEGIMNLGALLFKPPYLRVERIPITPNMLLQFAKSKKWLINYPIHNIPEKRYDLIFTEVIIIVFIVGLLIFYFS